MKDDNKGIGGFFEDLPVLAFILTGSLLVISTNVILTDQRADLEQLLALEQSAEKLADAVLLGLSEGGRIGITLDSLRLFDPSTLSLAIPSTDDWAVSVAIIHPWQEFVIAWCSGTSYSCAEAGWCSRLFIVDRGPLGTAVAEVVVVAYAQTPW